MNKKDEEITLKYFEKLCKPSLVWLLYITFLGSIFGFGFIVGIFSLGILSGWKAILWGVVTVPIMTYALWSWYAYFRDLFSYKKKAKELYEESLNRYDVELTEEEMKEYKKKLYYYMIKLPKISVIIYLVTYITAVTIKIYKGEKWLEVLIDARLIANLIILIMFIVIGYKLKKKHDKVIRNEYKSTNQLPYYPKG